MPKRGMEMTNYCSYRASGTDAAVIAMYEELRCNLELIEQLHGYPPKWENLDSDRQQDLRRIFQAGHKAYRDVIKAEIDSLKDGIPGSVTGRTQ